MSSLRLLALVVLVVSATAQSVSPLLSRAQQNDRKALMSLKNAVVTGGNRLNVWRATSTPCGAKPWPYVTCTDGRVTGINLANLGLALQLPTQLRLASELVTLNLQGNKISGSIPNRWLNQQTFRKLKVINLSENNINVAATSWLDLSTASARINSLRSLEVLDVSGNKLYGGLPEKWLTRNRVFRSLKVLDLSSNILGYTDAAGTTASTKQSDWCKDESNGAGWCPVIPVVTGTLASLEILDISNNDLTGDLPLLWPTMMPRLTSLLMANNFLFSALSGTAQAAETTAFPTPIPDQWAAGSKRGFPALQELVLYPGNPHLCSIPESTDGDYRDVNLEGSFKVLDNNDGQWGAENPAICPVDTAALPSDTKLPADSAKYDLTTTALTIEWGTDDAAATAYAKNIYGFRVTISLKKKDQDNVDVYEPIPTWNAKIVRSYTSNRNADVATAPEVTRTTNSWAINNLGLAATTDYQFDITVIAIDGTESAPVQVAITTP